MLRLILLGAAALAASLLAVALLATPSFAQEAAAPVTPPVAIASVASPADDARPARLRDPAARRAALLAMDTDHDGRWSKAEWIAAGRHPHSFDLMDTDNNGYLTPEELRAGLAKMREMRDAKPE